MAAAFKNVWTNSTPASPCNVTIAPAANDFLIAWVTNDSATAGDCDGIPAGWTRVTGMPLTSTFDNMTASFFYKVATGSETSVSFTASTGNTMIGGVLSCDGVDTGTPLDVTPVTLSSSASSATRDLSITPVTDGALIVYGIGQDDGNSDYSFAFSTTSGTTGAWTTRADQNSGFYNCGAGTASQTTAGALTARCTTTAGGSVCVLFALRPAGNPPLVGTTATVAVTGQPTSLNVVQTPSISDVPALGGGPLGAGPVGLSIKPKLSSAGAYTLTAANGSLTVTGQAAGLRAGRRLAAAQGSVAVTGQTAGLVHGYRLAAVAGTFAETGQAANLLAGRRLAGAQASVAVTGQAAGLLVGHRLAASQGSVAVTGQAANLRRGLRLTGTQAAVTLTGQAAGLLSGRRLSGTQAAVAVTGQAATLRAARRLSATQATVVVNGQAANLTKSSAGAYTLAASQGAFAVAGQAAALRSGRRLAGTQSAFVLSGQAATFRRTWVLLGGAGSYALTGQAAGLVHAGGVVYSARPISCICVDDADTIRAGVSDRGLFVLEASDADPFAVAFAEATDGVSVADRDTNRISISDMTCTC